MCSIIEHSYCICNTCSKYINFCMITPFDIHRTISVAQLINSASSLQGAERTYSLNEAGRQSTQNIPERDTDGEALPPGLLEIRRELNVLKNELKIQVVF